MTNEDPDSAWLTQHFRSFKDDTERLRLLVEISTMGIRVLTHMPKINEAIRQLHDLKGIVRKTDDKSLIFGEEYAEVAANEVNDGYPIIYTQFLVDIWGSLEACIRTLTAIWLEKVDDSMQSDAISRLKIRLGDYESRSGSDKYYYIVQLLEKEITANIKSGADRYESLLACIGLDGPIPRNLKAALFELSQLRNAIVHNARRADQPLLKACPWLNMALGQLIRPEPQLVHKLFRAVMDYAILVLARASAKLGAPIQDEIDITNARWAEST